VINKIYFECGLNIK